MIENSDSRMPSDIPFYKGHGTENDFILIPDRNARINLTPSRVQRLCDRRAGLGADGILRVATAGALIDQGVLSGLTANVTSETWFMDYRNSDGSIAELCGNGIRVFAHYLVSAGYVTDKDFVVGTRVGGRGVHVFTASQSHADVEVEMGQPDLLGISTAVIDSRRFAGIGIDLGNPHLAAIVPGLTAQELASLNLSIAPEFDHQFFPEGVNIEIVTPLAIASESPEIADEKSSTSDLSSVNRPSETPVGSIHMRVFERGSGETRSCGTGTVAAAFAALADAGREFGTVRVVVPGGELRVRFTQDQAYLRGSSVLVASGSIDREWWAQS